MKQGNGSVVAAMVAGALMLGAAAPAGAGQAEAEAFAHEGMNKQTVIVVPPEDRLAFIMKPEGTLSALGWGPQMCAGIQGGFWRVESGQFCLVIPWMNRCFDVGKDDAGYVLSAQDFPATHAPMSLGSLENCF